MSVYPNWLAGTKVNADTLTAGQTILVQKTADETVTSSVTLQNDDELKFSAVASAIYVVDAWIFAYQGASSATAIDINGDWSVPSGATGWKWCSGPALTMTNREAASMVTSLHGFGTDRNYGLDDSNNGVRIHEHLLINMSTTAGTVQYRWAQNTSSSSGTTVGAQSHLIIQRLG